MEVVTNGLFPIVWTGCVFTIVPHSPFVPFTIVHFPPFLSRALRTLLSLALIVLPCIYS